MLNGSDGECGWVEAAASRRRTCKHDVNSLFGALGSSGRRGLLVLLRALPRETAHHGRYGHTLRHDAGAHEQLALAALAVGEPLAGGERGAAMTKKTQMEKVQRL
jgi:hypothetical protein